MYLIANMTRHEVAARMEEYPVAILPVGSCEQHGPHLPLGTDSMLAEALARRVSDLTGCLVFPALNIGYSWVWRDIPGTLTVPPDLYTGLLREAMKSAARYGVKVLAVLNGHEANNYSIKYAVRAAQDEVDCKLLGMFYPGISEVYDRHMESKTWGGMFHADELETSLMLAVKPELVDMGKAVKEYPVRPAFYGMDNSSIGEISASGVYGDPTLATKEKGEKMLSAFSNKIADIITSAYAELRK